MVQISKYFKQQPKGKTPLCAALEKAYAKKTDKPLLIIMATDGKPNDKAKFMRLLGEDFRASDIYISIVACSDKEEEIGYLNGLDKKYARIDVIDDYKSEKRLQLGPGPASINRAAR